MPQRLSESEGATLSLDHLLSFSSSLTFGQVFKCNVAGHIGAADYGFERQFRRDSYSENLCTNNGFRRRSKSSPPGKFALVTFTLKASFRHILAFFVILR
eukprot:scaffold45158_cov161-Skeletonema_marinoi.AAC.3